MNKSSFHSFLCILLQPTDSMAACGKCTLRIAEWDFYLAAYRKRQQLLSVEAIPLLNQVDTRQFYFFCASSKHGIRVS